jgi:hypothetical protein
MKTIGVNEVACYAACVASVVASGSQREPVNSFELGETSLFSSL